MCDNVSRWTNSRCQLVTFQDKSNKLKKVVIMMCVTVTLMMVLIRLTTLIVKVLLQYDIVDYYDLDGDDNESKQIWWLWWWLWHGG